jgi:triacylglycerol lipase
MLQRITEPVVTVAHAARRPTTYTGQLKEAASTVLTASMWPLGVLDRGLADLAGLPARDGSPVDTPVLLVHGYGANKSNWLFLKRYLHHAGFERIHALNYNPLRDDIPGLATRCAERADELKAHFGVDRIHIIGHSLGGIIARYAVQVLGVEGVSVCISVASPHGGVRLARYGSLVARLGPLHSGLQLRPDSPVMRRLRTTSRPLPTQFVAYYSNLDLVVPARRAMIVEPALAATNILVKDQGHLSIMLSRRLAASVVDQLGAAEGLPGYGSPLRTLRPSATGSPRPEAAVAEAGRARAPRARPASAAR